MNLGADIKKLAADISVEVQEENWGLIEKYFEGVKKIEEACKLLPEEALEIEYQGGVKEFEKVCKDNLSMLLNGKMVEEIIKKAESRAESLRDSAKIILNGEVYTVDYEGMRRDRDGSIVRGPKG